MDLRLGTPVLGWSVGGLWCVVSGNISEFGGDTVDGHLYPTTTSGYGKTSHEFTRRVDEPKNVIPLSTKKSLDDLHLRT